MSTIKHRGNFIAGGVFIVVILTLAVYARLTNKDDTAIPIVNAPYVTFDQVPFNETETNSDKENVLMTLPPPPVTIVNPVPSETQAPMAQTSTLDPEADYCVATDRYCNLEYFLAMYPGETPIPYEPVIPPSTVAPPPLVTIPRTEENVSLMFGCLNGGGSVERVGDSSYELICVHE